MHFIVGSVIVSAAIIWSTRKMSEALVAAVNNLKTEVSETIQAVADKLAEIANNTGDAEAAAAINAQAAALDELQKGPLAPTPVEPPAA